MGGGLAEGKSFEQLRRAAHGGRMKRYPTWLVVGLLLAARALHGANDWKSLWNGRDFAGWDMFLAVPDATLDVPGLKRDANGKYLEPIGLNRDPLRVFTVATVDGRPAIHVSGQVFGTITTKESFGNFHLRMQVKWGEKKWAPKLNAPRDCGLLYFCHGPLGVEHGQWPRSVEFQIQEHEMGDLYALMSKVTVNARKDGRLWFYDPEGQPTLFEQKAPISNRCVKLGDPEKPNGEWNTLDLVCLGSDSIHIVNGVVVMRLHNAQRIDGGAPAPLSAGQISLQTEGAEVFYRDVELRAITAVPAEYAVK
jgi:hypothetical protein